MSMTPSTASASLVSMRATRPFAIGEVTMLPYARPGSLNSPAYFAAPVTLAGPSTRDVAVPTEAVMVRSLDFLVGLRLRRAARRLAERAHDGAARELDLERVVFEALGVAQHDVRCASEIFLG